jgi:hypothetical protein
LGFLEFTENFGEVSEAADFCDFYGEHAAFMTAKRADSEIFSNSVSVNVMQVILQFCNSGNSGLDKKPCLIVDIPFLRSFQNLRFSR